MWKNYQKKIIKYKFILSLPKIKINKTISSSIKINIIN